MNFKLKNFSKKMPKFYDFIFFEKNFFSKKQQNFYFFYKISNLCKKNFFLIKKLYLYKKFL